ncbi:hypothetical protein HIM_11140 [Hirsutella minnesotensis 3608]|uniref:FAD-binding FR-type domain-containing protein n=1 Tax=Hirsutella minnesotensis 3608 TaxID=1043627 RepID=A0A0F7ZRE6_9HYPO|nr:hypothetical protein HIM_11140 [Hirsutella minnesotensis 3608]
MANGSRPSATFSAMLARRTHYNEKLMLAFILSMLVIAAGFTLVHLVRRLEQHARLAREKDKPCLVARFSRKSRNICLRSIHGLPSVGHAIIVGLYVAINITITFVNIDHDSLPMVTNVGSRTAWLALGNLVIVVVLALKNNPLAYLTAWSYERLNIFHQVAGYTTAAFVIIHASCYSAYFVKSNRRDRLLQAKEIYGIVGGLSFFILGLAGATLRYWRYNTFYYVHVIFWVVCVVMTGLHQPDTNGKTFVVVTFVSSIWVLDSLLRLGRLVFYSTNSVKLEPLPNKGTRVILAKAPIGAVPGKHCYLWIPKIRHCETHPFTVSTIDPLEFIVTSHHRFTHDLYTYAMSHPGIRLKASVGGIYGSIPSPSRYDTVVLISGGCGGSFAFGMALDILRKLQSNQSKRIVFMWVIKHSCE